MAVSPPLRTGGLSREGWLDVLRRYAPPGQPSLRMRERRKKKRVPVKAFATIRCDGSSPAIGETLTIRWCPIVDVGPEGLALLCPQRLEEGTPLLMQVSLADKVFILRGKVVGVQGFPPRVRLGILLRFEKTAEDA